MKTTEASKGLRVNTGLNAGKLSTNHSRAGLKVNVQTKAGDEILNVVVPPDDILPPPPAPPPEPTRGRLKP